MKLVVEEPESAALREWLGKDAAMVSSVIGHVETMRAVAIAAETERSAGREGDAMRDAATGVLQRVELMALDGATMERASSVLPTRLRTLDAIHLASALEVSVLAALVTYDDRLAEAARSAGISVVQPGRADAEQNAAQGVS